MLYVFYSTGMKWKIIYDYFNYENDILVAEMGHYESEQYTKEIFYSIIQEMFPELEVQITRVNTNPIKYL